MPGIEDYAIIGDCRAAALVSRCGQIDWLCWPRFDSPSIFAALLDQERGGHWRIAPLGPYSAERAYVSESNVLETRFRTASGTLLLTDLMPVTESRASLVPDHEIVRRLSCTAGDAEVEVELVPRARYGGVVPALRQAGRLGIRIECGRGVYWLRSSIPLRLGEGVASAPTRLKAGQSLLFSFSYAEEAPAVLPPLEEIPQRIDECVCWWRRWAAQAQYDGEAREEVIRSALALKLLIFTPSGAIVAAPTTSLPERIGGGLNWDYRYCWLRDASLTIRALLELGYWEEAAHFLDWLLHATRLKQPELNIAYTVFGNPMPEEWESQTLAGYRGSRPVRIGNAARDQLQLDVYGEVIDAAAQYAFHGGTLDREMQKVMIGFGRYVIKHWELPDEGIWEPRSGRRHHTHSRLLSWTALDRLITLCHQGKLEHAPVDEYRKQADQIHRQIEAAGWNQRLGSYVSVLDGDQLDASLLLLSWYGFEKADSPRMRSTYRRLRERLGTADGLLYRSEPPAREGTFAICSFWAAEYLALGGGTVSEARDLLNTLLKYRNDIGLYGEEIEAGSGRFLGNFPQAFTHVGLIGAALSLNQRQKGEQPLAHRRESASRAEPHQKQPA
ncbi:MAG: glycoside hydrolase family 15 protein [Acidobacteria bacterium]|nr:glycoside hydrolase family 15 protein [Acidobacteriota bacterium]